MGLFDHFPYTNVHELNLDWVLSMMKALEAEWEAFTAGNSLIFSDPLLHDKTKTYSKNTIVLDNNGNAYVSLQAVPVGVSLDNQNYWLMVFDYEAFLEKVNKNFTVRYYRDQYRATAAMVIGDWLTVDDVLYKATAAIAVDDLLEVGVNIEHFTVEDFIKAFILSVNQTIQQYKNDIDASELAYRQQLAHDVEITVANLQAQLDAAISGATVDSEVINARVGADGITYPTLGDAIRTQFTNTEEAIRGRRIYLYPEFQDYYIDNTTGALTAYAGWSATDYIDISDISTLYATNIVEFQTFNAFYDKDKNFISNFRINTTETTIAVPKNAKYMRISDQTARFGGKRVRYEPKNYAQYSRDVLIYPAIADKYISNTDGSEVAYNDWSISNDIDVSNIGTIYIKFPITHYNYNAFYDSSDNFICSFYIYSYETAIHVPYNATKLRISHPTNNFNLITGWYEFKARNVLNSIRVPAKVKGISRLGIKTTAPEQSIYSYQAAVQAGFKCLLCDLQFTSDGYAVCLHDPTINRVARNSDGTTIGTTLRVDSLTLAQLNTYDFGIYAGAEYAGTKALLLSDFLSFCKMCDVEAYIEIKAGNKNDISYAVRLVGQMGMIDNVSWAAHFEDSNNDPLYHADWVVSQNPNCRVALMTNGDGITASAGYKDHLVSLKTGLNQVFCFNWNTETVTQNERDWMAANGIDYEVGTINTESGIENYYANHTFVTAIESDLYDATQVLKNYAMNM